MYDQIIHRRIWENAWHLIKPFRSIDGYKTSIVSKMGDTVRQETDHLENLDTFPFSNPP